MRALAPVLLLLALVACGRQEAELPRASAAATSNVTTMPATAPASAAASTNAVSSASASPAASAGTSSVEAPGGANAPPADAPAASGSAANGSAITSPHRLPVVVFLGDSLTAGLGVGEDEAFPARVGALLRAQGTPIQVLNAGVSGDTSAGGLRRLSWVLRQHPDVLVVEVGANDGLRGLSVASLEANLHDIVAKAQAAGSSVLLLGVRVPPSLGGDYADQLAAVYPRVARETHAALVPFFLAGVGGHADLNQADGIHPNARGHEIVARNVLPALTGVLRARARTAATR